MTADGKSLGNQTGVSDVASGNGVGLIGGLHHGSVIGMSFAPLGKLRSTRKIWKRKDINT